MADVELIDNFLQNGDSLLNGLGRLAKFNSLEDLDLDQEVEKVFQVLLESIDEDPKGAAATLTILAICHRIRQLQAN